jgi:hypothetical protein
MDAGFLFEDNVVCVKCNNFNTALADGDYLPASGSFIDMAGIDHGVFLVGMGTLDTATTFTVKQDTSATVTGSVKGLASAAVQLVAADDDNKWLTIEFNANQLDRTNSFRYVTLKADGPAGSNDYACVFFLGFKSRKAPVSKAANYAYHVAVVG